MSFSRWAAWQEMADAVLTGLRCPLSLPDLRRRGRRLRWQFRVDRPKRPLQMEHATKAFLS